MHFATDLSTALQNIEAVKAVIDATDDPKLQLNTADNLKLLIGLLQDPVLRSVVQVQDSLLDLNKQIVQHPSMLPSDFDISLAGDLVLSVPHSPHSPHSADEIYDAGAAGAAAAVAASAASLAALSDEQRVPSAQLSPHSGGHHQASLASLSTVTAAKSTLTAEEAMLLLQQQQQQQLQLQHQHGGDHDTAAILQQAAVVAAAAAAAKQQPPQPPVVDLMAAEWALIQPLELVNDGTGLGFGIIGARTAGVIVKTIMPGGVADRDGRLLSGDHILRIGDVDLHDMVSEQVASVLRQSGTHVRLVVARSLDARAAGGSGGGVVETEGCVVVPGRLLSQPRELDRYMVAAGYADGMPAGCGDDSGGAATPMLPASSPPPPLPTGSLVHHAEDFSFHEVLPPVPQHAASAAAAAAASNIANRPMLLPPHELEQQLLLQQQQQQLLELPETDRFIVELTKDANGLGITIAGYVCEKEELSGIFVKSVSPGSAADLSGSIRVNDRIIEVDQQPLQGFSNHQAVEVLKKSGSVVRLCLERYLRGPKFEQLQQAIAANEQVTSTAAAAVTASPSAVVKNQARPASSLGSGSGAGTPAAMRRRQEEDEAAATSAASASSLLTTGASGRKLLTRARDSLDANESGSGGGVKPLTPVAMVLPSSSPPLPPVPAAAAALRHKYWVEPVLTTDMEESIRQHWRAIMPPDTRIIVAQIRKFAASSGLGISLEGTVDVEGGMEVRPHHYIRSILPEGPVGQNGLLRSSDELLEVNKQRLLGMNHLEVVSILKELPQDVRMVCARTAQLGDSMVPFTEEALRGAAGTSATAGAAGGGFGGSQNIADKQAALMASERLVKAKSDGSLATSGTGADDSFSKLKSRSLEPLTGLAMWASEPQIIELVKGDRGLGFSILDYQDPMDPKDTLIVIRSLVPGGVAQLDGRLIPGDRLMFVNDINLENSSLDQAVQALKGAARGVVRIGVAKPLPLAENSLDLSTASASEMAVAVAGDDSSGASSSALLSTVRATSSGVQQQLQGDFQHAEWMGK